MATAISGLSKEMDNDGMQRVSVRVDRLSTDVIELANEITKNVCYDLDVYMQEIDNVLASADSPISDTELETFILNLSSLLYLVSDAQEDLGIKEDVSRAIQKDVYNRVREKAEGTVADKDAAAELQCQAEMVTTVVYARAYKKVKLRVEAAGEMVVTLKKVLSKRITDMEVSHSDLGNTGR